MNWSRTKCTSTEWSETSFSDLLSSLTPSSEYLQFLNQSIVTIHRNRSTKHGFETSWESKSKSKLTCIWSSQGKSTRLHPIRLHHTPSSSSNNNITLNNQQLRKRLVTPEKKNESYYTLTAKSALRSLNDLAKRCGRPSVSTRGSQLSWLL